MSDQNLARPPLRLVRFGSLTCPACMAMAKQGTLDKFKAAHPDVQVVSYDVSDAQGKSPDGTPFEAAYKLSDEYEVTALPTLIFEAKDVGEVFRVEGAVNARALEKALEQANETLDNAMVSIALSKQGW